MSLPQLAFFDLTPVGAKIEQAIRLTGVLIEITIEEKHQRDFLSGLARMEDGINNLRRLPGTAYAVTALSLELSEARQIVDPALGVVAVKALLRKLKEAHALADKARKDEQKRQEALAAQHREAMTDEIAYQSLHEVVENRLRWLNSRSLIKQVSDFSERITAAEGARDGADELLARGETSAAVVAIRKADADALQIVVDWTSTIRKMKSRHAKVIEKATRYHKTFIDPGVLPEADRVRLVKKLDERVLPLLQNKPNKTETKLIAKSIDALNEEAQQIIKASEERKATAERFVRPSVARMRGLLALALGRELAGELKAAADAERFLEQRDYDAAIDAARALEDGYAVLEDRLFRAHSAWQKALSSTLPAQTQRLQKQRENAEAHAFDYKHDPDQLIHARFALEEGVMTATSCTDALALVTRLVEAADENEALFEAWDGIHTHRTAEDKKVRVVASAASDALERLTAEMIKVMAEREQAIDSWQPHDVGGLQTRLAAALGDWDGMRKTATTVGDLSADATVALIRKITEDVEAVISGGTAGALVDTDLYAAAEARYRAAEKSLSAALPQWELFPIPRVEALRAVLEKGQQDFSSANSAAEVDEIVALLDAASRRGRIDAGLVEGLLNIARSGLTDKVLMARAAVKQLDKAAAKRSLLSNSDIKKTRARCAVEAQRLAEQIDTIAGRHASDLLDVFHEGTIALNVVIQRCGKLTALCKTGDESEVVLPDTFASVVKSYHTKLKSKDLAAFRPSDLYVLREDLGAIEKRLGADEHTTRIEASLEEWSQKLDDAMALVARDKREKASFDQLYEVVKGTLKKKKALFRGYEAFYDKLKGDLKAAKQQSETEDGIRSADATIRVAKAAMERVIVASTEEGRERGLTLDQELRHGQESATAGTERQKDQKAAWEARVTVFRSRWLRLLPLDEKDARGLLSIAEKSAGQKPPDYEAANRYLKMAADRAQLALQFPGGPVAVSLSKLPKQGQDWTGAVASYRGSFESLGGAFGELDDPAGAALAAGIAALKLLFDPNAFATIIPRICAKGAGVDERARAREEALAVVRRYRSVLVKDGRFNLLSKHPFSDAGAWKGHLIIQQPLIELERLLLMAVPTT